MNTSTDDEILASARRACAKATELLADGSTAAAEYFRTAASEYRRVGYSSVADLMASQALACEPAS